jgi:hypothetical protein
MSCRYERIEEHTLDTEAYTNQLQAALQTADLPSEAYACRNLGRVYQAQGKYNLSLKHFTRDMALAEQAGDQCGEAVGCANLAGVYQMMGDLDSAQRFNSQHITMVAATGDMRWLASARTKMAETYEASAFITLCTQKGVGMCACRCGGLCSKKRQHSVGCAVYVLAGKARPCSQSRAIVLTLIMPLPHPCPV